MTIYDYWLNPLVPAPVQVIGYRGLIEEFPHDLYSFLLSTIREQDQENTILIWRWLQPMQQFWESMYGTMLSVPYLKSPSQCPAPLLEYLRKDVGIMDDLGYVWGYLNEADKRRFIKFFVRFLKYRATGFGLDEMIETMTGQRVEIQNYFDFRWILGGDLASQRETATGRDDDGYDSWLLSEQSLPSGGIPDVVSVTVESGMTFYHFRLDDFVSELEDLPVPQYVYIKHIGTGFGQYAAIYNDGTYWRATMAPDFIFGQAPSSLSTDVVNFRVTFESDEFVFDVIVEDDGTLNRDMVKGLVRFSRPQSERVYVRYYTFVEFFKSFDRWDELSGTATWSETNQNVVLYDAAATTMIQVNLVESEDWATYGLHIKMKHGVNNKTIQIRFMVQDASNYYYLRLIPSVPPTIPQGVWSLRQVVGAVDTELSNGTLEWFDVNVDYVWRIESITSDRPGGIFQVLRVYQDEDLLTTVIDNSTPWSGNIKGTIALVVETGGRLTVSRVLVHPIPMESDFVGP